MKIPDSYLRCMNRPKTLQSPPTGQQQPSILAPVVPAETVLTPKTGQDSGSGVFSVFIPCSIPTTTHQQKGAFAAKGGGVRFFKKKKTKEAEKQIQAFLCPYVPAAPFTGPLLVEADMLFPWRKSERKGIIRQFQEYPISVSPDAENLWKSISDQMTELGYWGDDGQVSELILRKLYADTPGLRLRITSSIPKAR